ncbi:hypothetical protein GCM10010124_04860 [Pilimelia terevasa]|uniref:Tyrosinase co-factor MelC1 n=1 Tax=Pilimelia terevasa TaxID=53372 RepID=A0A8J3BJM4_9ACTN|nr:tyrosinase family oxidase copper chaperone [Pilimelia terevasa]GGK15268.1 hypothetical protein GCM10010124_04860 [Pilimelia terevasa]
MTLDRRDLLRYGAASAAAAATAAGASYVTSGATAATPAPDDPRDFDQEYKGKKIKGVHDKGNKKHKVSINGKKLGIMVLQVPVAEDSRETMDVAISALTHYEPFPIDERDKKDGLLKLAKKAVETLGDAELTDLAGDDHDHR